MAVQLGRHFGAEVTAVGSAPKLAMLRAIVADHVVGCQQENFARNGQTYEVICDVAGMSPFSASRRSLNPGGRYLLGNPGLAERTRAPWNSSRNGNRVVIGGASHQTEDSVFLAGLIEGGKIMAVIDRRYSSAQNAEAHRYVETGRKQGSVVITVTQQDLGAELMPDAQIRLSLIWVALMLTYLLGDVLRIFSGDAASGKMGDTQQFTQGMWLGIALLMVIPVLMIVLSLVQPYPVNRWATIIVAVAFFLFNLVGLPTYPGTYDKFLIVIGLGFNVLTVWYSWKWVQRHGKCSAVVPASARVAGVRREE